MVAGTELPKYGSDHEIISWNSQKSQSFPNTNLDRLGKTGNLQLRSFTFALPKVVIPVHLRFL